MAKSYIGEVDGIVYRVRADKKPSKKTQEALNALVKAAYKHVKKDDTKNSIRRKE